MKQMMILVVLFSGLMLVLAGCSSKSSVSTNPVEPRINEEKAVALATLWIPSEIVPQAGVRARLISLSSDAGEELKQNCPPLETGHNYWAVVFDVNNLTSEQLGWEASSSVDLGLEEVYQTLQIYIDAETGGTTFRKAAAGIKLGGPITEPTKVFGAVKPSVIIAGIIGAIISFIIIGYLVMKHRRQRRLNM